MLKWITLGKGVDATTKCELKEATMEGVPSYPHLKPDVQPVKSSVIDKKMNEVADMIKDKHLKLLFTNVYQNTLQTTTAFTDSDEKDKLDTFVITGDIDAMWIRDSTNQMLPFLRYIKDDKTLDRVMIGLINRQKANVGYDPYANAFNPYYMNPNPSGNQESDLTTKLVCATKDGKQVCHEQKAMTPFLWERKFELDGLAHFLRFSWDYSRAAENVATDLSAPFDHQWVDTMKRVIETATQQMKGTDEEKMSQNGCRGYSFSRKSGEALDSLMKEVGHPAPADVGLVRAGFRPSDDAQTFPYLIPANYMFANYLGKICSDEKVFKKVFVLANQMRPNDVFSVDDCNKMVNTINAALEKHGTMLVQKPDPAGDDGPKTVYAYEVDGNGNTYFMDDANVPGLLSLPLYTDIPMNDATYKQTREMVLSSRNAYYGVSSEANKTGVEYKAIGGPHEWLDMIWPMAMVNQALTVDKKKRSSRGQDRSERSH